MKIVKTEYVILKTAEGIHQNIHFVEYSLQFLRDRTWKMRQ